MSDFHESTARAVAQLQARFPDAPFLTLGQTVLWDEPVKAVLCRALEVLAPQARIVAGVHDTDYFAKLAQLEELPEKFVMLPHNDGATRGLWSAAGELSCVFGSESVPSRGVLQERGVAFDRVARGYPGGTSALLDRETNAPGWRALVHTEGHPLIAADVKLSDIGPALIAQLEWGFSESANVVGHGAAGTEVVRRIIGWVGDYLLQWPQNMLSDLYRALTPRLWSLVRGEGSCNLETTTSLELFQFNTKTCDRPRFAFVDLFLQKNTREYSRSAYDDAVRGSGIYQLAQFGDGALPFDVVVPGRGRGTLRLHDGSLFIETEEPFTLCTGCDCDNIRDLARLLEETFGEKVALVGKAVALISMLAAEFIFVFHETASGYTVHTQKMNAALREHGIALPLMPMLRLRYETWDALKNVDATFKLPPYLSNAFGAEKISASDFATRWKTVCDEQDELCEKLKACRSPRELMKFLAEENAENGWPESLREYSQARSELREVRRQSQIAQEESEAFYAQSRAARDEAAAIERSKGEDFRATVLPLKARLFDIKENAFARAAQNATRKLSKTERAEIAQNEADEATEIANLRARIESEIARRVSFDEKISAARNRAHELSDKARASTRRRIEIEKNDAAKTARAVVSRLEYEAEWRRFQLVRDAFLARDSLHHTNSRPTAWWFPLVSPDGKWLHALAATMQARIEEL